MIVFRGTSESIRELEPGGAAVIIDTEEIISVDGD